MLTVNFGATSITSFEGIKLVSYDIPVGPAIKNTGINIPGDDGEYRINSPYGAEQFTIDIIVEATNTSVVSQRLRNFVTWLGNQGDMRITFSDDETVFRYAKYQSSSSYNIIDGIVHKGIQATITFHMADPFVYRSSPNSFEQTITSGTTFVIENSGIHAPYNLSVSGATTTGSPSYDITINSPESDFYSHIVYGAPVTASDVITVSSLDYTIYKNDVVDIVNFSGDVINLLGPGSNTIRIVRGGSGNINVALEWNTRYL